MADVCVVRAAGLAEWTNMSKVQQAPWFYMQREAKRVYESTHKYWENEKTRLTRQAATVTAAKAAAAKRKAKTAAKAKQTVTGAKSRGRSHVRRVWWRSHVWRKDLSAARWKNLWMLTPSYRIRIQLSLGLLDVKINERSARAPGLMELMKTTSCFRAAVII